jgi:hypothetical protein
LQDYNNKLQSWRSIDMNTYVLASGRKNRLLFVCGIGVDQSLERARHFESPAEALAFRAHLVRKRGWADTSFIVHEYDGNLLHSLELSR